MRIFVTGGAGFIGKNLCLSLLRLGHEIVVVDNFITSDFEDFKNINLLKKVKLIKADINDSGFIKEAGNLKFDQIFHLACPTGVPNLRKLAVEMLITCSIGTKNVLDLGLKQGSKVILASSSEVYGDPQEFPQKESYTGNVDIVGPRSPYEEGKRFAESMMSVYCNKLGLDGRIVRIFNTYGPYFNFEESRVIPKFLMDAVRGEDIQVKGDGSQTRTFCFIEDLIKGLEIIMSKGEVGGVYNLGSEKEITILRLAKLIKKVTNSKSKIVFTDREGHDHGGRRPDLARVKELGYLETIRLKDGLEKTRGWLVKNRKDEL